MTMQPRNTDNNTWKWVVGILTGVLITLGGAVGSTLTMRLESQEVRLTAVEKAIAVSETNANYIKAAVDEIKGLVKEHMREGK